MRSDALLLILACKSRMTIAQAGDRAADDDEALKASSGCGCEG
jgi:hypothetical protein